MRQRPFLCLARLSGAILLTGVLSCAHAVELGDALVRSHIGQPLSADIELTGIPNEAATVQVGLADIDVYRGANIAMHPALAALNITITRRDGKRFLHITSPKPVDSEFIHIFFDLNENGRHAVRQTTLWFTPDPNPAPPKVAPAPACGAAAAGRRSPAPGHCAATATRPPAAAPVPHAVAAAKAAPVPAPVFAPPARAGRLRPAIYRRPDRHLRGARCQKRRAQRPDRRAGREGQAPDGRDARRRRAGRGRHRRSGRQADAGQADADDADGRAGRASPPAPRRGCSSASPAPPCSRWSACCCISATQAQIGQDQNGGPGQPGLHGQRQKSPVAGQEEDTGTSAAS